MLSFTPSQRDHVTTFLAEGMVLLATVLVYRLAATELGDGGFERYTVVRRTTSFVQIIALCGLGVGIVRFAAMAPTNENRVGLLKVAVERLGKVSAGLLVIGWLFPAGLSSLFFGSAAYGTLILPVVLLAVGLLFHTLIHGYLRGASRLGTANVLQVASLGVVPVAAMFLFADLEGVLWATGGAWIVFSGVAIAASLMSAKPNVDREEARMMIRFGTLRLPGDLLFASLLSVPVFVVNHVEGIAVGAGIAFAITLVNVAGAVYSPLSLILLPSVSAHIAKREWRQLFDRIRSVQRFVVVAGIIMVVAFEILATPLLHLYLGDLGTAMEPICRVAFLAAFPLGVFVSLRSVLDAYYHSPRNTFNLFGAFLVFALIVIVYWSMPPVWWFSSALMVVPLLVLAVLTWHDVSLVLLRLRHRLNGSTTVKVLEPIRSVENGPAPNDPADWITARLPTGRGLLAILSGISTLRKEERRSHPEHLVVRDDPWAAIIYAITLRTPLALVVSGAVTARTYRSAAVLASLVICRSGIMQERLTGWATRMYVVEKFDKNSILAALNMERGQGDE